LNIVGKTRVKAIHIGNQKVEEIVGRIKIQEKAVATFLFSPFFMDKKPLNIIFCLRVNI